MSIKSLFSLAIFLVTLSMFIWGCQMNQPSSPNKNVAMSVFVPNSGEVKASLIGVASNELFYRVDGPGHTLLANGTVGPFSTTASSGSFDFAMDVPAENSLVLSLQLNDASTHQPLAVGATVLNMLSSPVTNVVVDMGSVTRNCYTLNVPSSAGVSDIYTFANDSLVQNGFPTNFDFQLQYAAGASNVITIYGASVSAFAPILPTVAYLGNGNLVDYDYVPLATSFQTTSILAKGGPASVGDIFCLDLLSIPVNGGGHAWIQIINLGNVNAGPRFRYRANSTSPYYGYERTTADLSNACSIAW